MLFGPSQGSVESQIATPKTAAKTAMPAGPDGASDDHSTTNNKRSVLSRY